jgi:S-adenosylmethionine:tRNA ribosyltransferase-isomerase
VHPKDIKIAEYTYSLPEEKIALHPLATRDASKLVIWNDGIIKDDVYKNIAGYFDSKSLLVFNDTKVIPARIFFTTETGAKIELFCLEPFDSQGNYQAALQSKSPVSWKCMIGKADKWKTKFLNKNIFISDKQVVLQARFIDKLPDSFIIEFTWNDEQITFTEIIENTGNIPLPPYIKRQTEQEDADRYQTVFAQHKGSVAAPTAALHFTHNILNELKEKKIDTDFVTLHVGAGTFKPVKTELIGDHNMHAEWINVSINIIKNIIDHLDKNITAVGTTSLRTIESLYWMGVKTYLNKDLQESDIDIKQWEVYDELAKNNIGVRESLESLYEWFAKKDKTNLVTQTQIIIAPGYQFKIVNALVTNFHQPNSTLLLLIAAATKHWRKIYHHALNNNYRFLSYGDGCLIYFDRDK